MKSVLHSILMFVAGLIIFIGLPMVGWGIFHILEFFDSPARMAYIAVTIFLQLFTVLYLPPAMRTKEKQEGGKGRPKIDLILLQITSLAIVLVAPYSDRHFLGAFDIGDTIRCLGLVPLAFGLVLMQMAEKYLGRQFSIEITLKENHRLITSGPYRLIRHPRYLGIITFFLGMSLVFRSYLAAILVVALSVILLWRIHAEESMLQREFGETWDEYCAKSWRLIPFLF